MSGRDGSTAVLGRLPVFLALLLLLPAETAIASLGRVPSPQTSAGCTLSDGVYHCDLLALQRTLRQAATVRLETQRLDRTTAAQLRDLVLKLGKQVRSADQPADLVFALTPVESPGVIYGPGDHDLATLRVYKTEPERGHGSLIWAETLRGQGDRPWPAQVHVLIEQFRARLGQR